MELDVLKLHTTWNDAANSINTNFSKIKTAISHPSEGGGDVHYEHMQSIATDEWVIDHNLNKFPSVTVVDSAGTVVYGEVYYPNKNKVIIKFMAAFSGRAYLN